jgi:hypothetical protein
MYTIELFTICYNEEKILPFFLDHYSFCKKINIYDNNSTDNSVNIARNCTFANVNVINYDTNNTLDDSVYLQIKNNVWKNSDCDYVIVVDMDEFLYHPNFEQFINDTQQPVYKPYGYNMVSESFPISGKFISQIKTGVPDINYNKQVLFSPNTISEINYTLGCHHADPLDKNGHSVTALQYNELKLLHYKNISIDYKLEKHKLYSSRFSEYNKQTGAGIHYTDSRESQIDVFNQMLKHSTIII